MSVVNASTDVFKIIATKHVSVRNAFKSARKMRLGMHVAMRLQKMYDCYSYCYKKICMKTRCASKGVFERTIHASVKCICV